MKLTIETIKKLNYTLPEQESVSGQSYFSRQVFWDDELPGFGVRVFPTGKKSFVHKYRNAQGQQRQTTIGDCSKITLMEARKVVREQSVDISRGSDPLEDKNKARKGALISTLCAVYMERHAKPNKKTWKADEGRINLYIIPHFGSKQIQQVKRADIARLHDLIGRVNDKPYMANRLREQLSKMFELAKVWGYVEETFVNPAKGITDFAEHERSAYIMPEHMPIVAGAINNEPNLITQNIIWLYLLTGKRRSELLSVKWSDVDSKARTLKIADTKNGETEFVQLNTGAWEILEKAKRFRVVGNPYIFPGDKAGQHFVNIDKVWNRIKAVALENGAVSVENVPIHGLRHTFAVWLTSMGEADLGMIRKLLNHKSLLATKVYAKYQSSAVKIAVERAGDLVKEFSQKPSNVETLNSGKKKIR